ncbi:MAG: succinate dehydrogenase, hydrophobic membrane anchor protein [Gemmatimonadota bacterium]
MSERRPGGGHRRPGSRGFEAYAWLFMRLSGVVLLGLAVFHLLWMHFAIGVDNIDFQTVAERWANPLWRIYDLALLVFALSHGVNGLRTVLEDYVRTPRRLLAVKGAVYVVAFVLLSMGSWIIFTFDVPA